MALPMPGCAVQADTSHATVLHTVQPASLRRPRAFIAAQRLRVERRA